MVRCSWWEGNNKKMVIVAGSKTLKAAAMLGLRWTAAWWWQTQGDGDTMAMDSDTWQDDGRGCSQAGPWGQGMGERCSPPSQTPPLVIPCTWPLLGPKVFFPMHFAKWAGGLNFSLPPLTLQNCPVVVFTSLKYTMKVQWYSWCWRKLKIHCGTIPLACRQQRMIESYEAWAQESGVE